MIAVAFFFLAAGTLAALVGVVGYVWVATHPDEWPEITQRESLRRGMQVEPFTGRTR